MIKFYYAIQPQKLMDEYLLKEHLYLSILIEKFQTNNNDLSKEEIFLLNRPFFTLKRYLLLYEECRLRNYSISNYSLNWNVYSSFTNENNYFPTKKEYIDQIEKIKTLIIKSEKEYFLYYKVTFSKPKVLELLNFE